MNNKYINGSVIFGIAILMISGLSSCKKFLEPDSPSLISNAEIFSNVTSTKMAVIGVYQDLAGDQGYGIRISMYYPYDNDETMGPSKTGDNDRGDIAHYNATAINLQLYAPYVQLYQGIERANICIYNIPKMSLYTNPSSSAELQRLYGEALTLRAQFYMELIRNWGDVPAQFLPSSESKNLFIGKTNRDTIYNHLLNDLLLAETLVPWRDAVKADERITKGAVKALRARIALYRGGYDLRDNGTISRDDAHYLDYYKIALDECNDIINSGKHALNPSYKSIFKDGICAHAADPSNELLFEVAMGGGTGLTDSKLGIYNGPKFAGSYTPVSSAGTISASYNFLNGSGTLLMLPTYFYLFDSKDTRRDVTIAPYDVLSDFSKIGNKITAMRDGKFRGDWVTPAPTSGASYMGLNWPLIRYSDVLLMFAEADNELNNGPSAAAVSAYNSVRTRGFGGDPSLIGTTPTTHDDFFKAIVRERSLEFGAEGIRKYDLKRWGLLAKAINETKANLGTIISNKALAKTSYMAEPSDYALTGPLPTSMYFNYPGDAGNPAGMSKAVDDSTLWINSFYAKQPSITVTTTMERPVNTKVSWIGSGITTTFSKFFASGFVEKHSELFPIPQAVIDASNGAVTQNNGY